MASSNQRNHDFIYNDRKYSRNAHRSYAHRKYSRNARKYSRKYSSWIIDNGCTNHMTGEKKMFTCYVKNKDS
jgi:hypothetical protein